MLDCRKKLGFPDTGYSDNRDMMRSLSSREKPEELSDLFQLSVVVGCVFRLLPEIL
jgi:hypothetical protein